MKTKLNYLLILITVVILNSCGNPEPKQNDFIGIWKSSDGAYITLSQDGSCILKGVDYFKISSFPQNKNKRLNVKGTWSFVDGVESGIIDGINKGINIIYQIPDRKGEGSITFYISGVGFLGNKKPWSIYIWNGDPDDMNKYEFIKE